MWALIGATPWIYTLQTTVFWGVAELAETLRNGLSLSETDPSNAEVSSCIRIGTWECFNLVGILSKDF